MGWFSKVTEKPERDPTLTEILARVVELENEWRSFLTQEARYRARMAKRAKDDLERGDRPVDGRALNNPNDHKAELRRRAMGLRVGHRGGAE